MKSTVETLSPTRVRLDVEVPFSELTPSINKAYKSINRQITVPGFRKGKVPPRLIDRHVGRAAVLEEAINDAIPGTLSKAFAEHELRVLGRPEVNPTELADGDKFTFTADVEVRPELELPDYSTLDVTVDEVVVSEADIDAEIGKLADRFGILKSVDRPVQTDDYVSIDLQATVDGQEVPGGSATNISYQVGKGDLLDGLDEALTGMAATENKVFTTKLVGGELAGQQADVSVIVNSIKIKEQPTLDDEFAQTASEFDTMADLREKTAEQLKQQKTIQQALQARDNTLTALLAAVEVPLPERVVDSEVEYRRTELEQTLTRMNMSMENYLKTLDKNEEEFTEQIRTDAQEAIRAQLVLDTVADKEQVEVSQDELTQEIVNRARQAYVGPQEYANHLMESGQIALVAADVRRGKALALVGEQAKVTDSAGHPVDLKAATSQEP